MYHHLRFLNCFFFCFGLTKPFLKAKPLKHQYLRIIWTLTILALYLGVSIINVTNGNTNNFTVKYNLGSLYYLNDVVLNSLVIVGNMVKGDAVCTALYTSVLRVLKQMNLQNQSLKEFSKKIYFWAIVQLAILFACVFLEIFYEPTSPLLARRLPTMVALIHLELHLCIIISLLKNVNELISKRIQLTDKYNLFVKKNEMEENSFLYLLSPKMYFRSDKTFDSARGDIELKEISRVYDELSNCIQLLEQQHGFQILLDIWMNFVTGVMQITILASKSSNYPPIEILKLAVPFLWHLILAYLDDQIRQEVERTDTLVMKHLIDYRCGDSERNILQSFKQLVSTNRLKFRAFGLFYIDYAMVLGTFVSVVTYSIIVIQLFMDGN